MKKILFSAFFFVLCTLLLVSCECNHNEVVDISIASSCVSTGLSEGKHCSKCGVVFTEQEVLSTVEHTYENGKCTVCDKPDPSVHIHTEITDIAIPATCTNTGLTEGKHCSTCGKVFIAQIVVPVQAHNYKDGRCAECNTPDPNAHIHAWKNATCTAPKTCTKCQATEGSALGHTFGEWNTLTGPTCNREGVKTRLCKTCGTIEQGMIPVNDEHTPETIPAVDATCVKAGSTAGLKCTYCEKVLTVPQTVVATGIHKFSARWYKTPDGHFHPCLYCDATSATEEHVDYNNDSICDVCYYEDEGVARYQASTIKEKNVSSESIDVAALVVENEIATTNNSITFYNPKKWKVVFELYIKK